MKTLPRPLSAAEIAALVGGRVIGDAHHRVEAVAEVAAAGERDAATFHNMKYAAEASASKAGVLFIPPRAADAASSAKARVVVDDPQAAFAVLLGLIDAANDRKAPVGVNAHASISAHAKLGAGIAVGAFVVVESGAEIGDGTVLMPQVYVGARAKIGKNCLLYPQVVVRDECVIGDRVVIHPGTVVGADGFGFTTDKKTGRHTKIPQIGNVVIGDGCEIGANVTIDRATLGSTIIESGVQIDNLVQIAHNVKLGRDTVVVSQVGIAGSTTVGRNVVLAGQAGVAGHLSIGDGAVITAQTGVMSDVPAKSILFGSPGRPHRESFRLQALYSRLPEIAERLKALEKKLGLDGHSAPEA